MKVSEWKKEGKEGRKGKEGREGSEKGLNTGNGERVREELELV